MTGATTVGPAPASARRDGAIGVPPGSWTQALLMSRYQFRDYLRSRRFILMTGIVAAICAILITVVAYYRPAALISSGTAWFGMTWVNGAAILTLFAVIIYGGDAIAGEFQNKTGYFLMGLPIKRWTVYAGKYMAVYAAALLSILLYLVVLILSGFYFVGPHALSIGVLESFVLAVLYLGAVLGTTFLFSSMFKVSMYGVIIVAIMFLIGFTIIEGVIEGLVGITPWFIITWASPVIGYPIGGVPHNAGMRLDNIIQAPTYLQGIIVMIGYLVGTTAGGLVLFEREEFT